VAKKINYKKKLDTIFSVYIRQRKADDNGYAQCVTCGKVDQWKHLQNGHYVGRGFMGTRFDEENCNVQCDRCNRRLKGNMDEYAIYLKQEYGDDILDRLHQKKRAGRKIGAGEYRELLEHYKEKLESLSHLS